jgi:hypothetical protein
MKTLKRRAIVLALLVGATFAAGAESGTKKLGEACTTDAECQDESFCNGREQCNGTCIRAPLPGCMAGEQCNEDLDRCIVHRTDADGDGHANQATGGDDCDDYDRNAFPGNPEVWDDADHDEDCNAFSHGVPTAFGAVGVPGRGQACSGESVVTLVRSADGTDAFSQTSCGAGMACSGPGVCVASAAGYTAPPSWRLPGNQVHASHDVAMKALMAPVAMKPLMPGARPTAARTVRPMVTGLSKPCPKGMVRDAASGACAAYACPPGTFFDAAKGACAVDAQH